MEMRPDTYTNDSGQQTQLNVPAWSFTPLKRRQHCPATTRSPIHPGYTHVIGGGGFGSGQGADIFCYDPVLGQGDVWHRTDSAAWSAGPDHLVAQRLHIGHRRQPSRQRQP